MKFRPLALAVLLCFYIIPMQASAGNPIRLATTTSTDNSGLLSTLLPAFTADTGYQVHIIAVGTGKALRLGKDGDIDVVLVHAPNAEHEFVASGYGLQRHAVMVNDFVIVGPENDPAHIASANSINQVFTQIRDSKNLFLSRGDNSGTHIKERSIWKASGIKPSGSWYREVGQGMGKVLQMANEMDAYTLADRGTWLAYKNKTQLKLCYEGESSLLNPYAIIAVNPHRYPDINFVGASALIDWMTSQTKGQRLIGQYKQSGKQLFIPIAK